MNQGGLPKETATAAEAMKNIIEDTGGESPGAKQLVYISTISRVLPNTLMATDLRDMPCALAVITTPRAQWQSMLPS